MQINARLHGCIHKACAAPGIHRHHTNDHPIRYPFTPSLSVIQTHCSLCPYLARKLHKYKPSRGYTGIDNVYATYVSVLGTRSRHGGSSKANGSPQVFRNRSPLESILNSHTTHRQERTVHGKHPQRHSVRLCRRDITETELFHSTGYAVPSHECSSNPNRIPPQPRSL